MLFVSVLCLMRFQGAFYPQNHTLHSMCKYIHYIIYIYNIYVGNIHASNEPPLVSMHYWRLGGDWETRAFLGDTLRRSEAEGRCIVAD